jgi:PRTRC genetic system protein E
MFTELESLLADRTLLLTLSAVPGGAIRVNVIPKCRNENDAAEKALATPLSVTGTAAELDRDFPAQLTGYVQSILETDSTLNQIREAHKAALKELEAENKKALDSKRKTNTAPNRSQSPTIRRMQKMTPKSRRSRRCSLPWSACSTSRPNRPLHQLMRRS